MNYEGILQFRGKWRDYHTWAVGGAYYGGVSLRREESGGNDKPFDAGCHVCGIYYKTRCPEWKSCCCAPKGKVKGALE